MEPERILASFPEYSRTRRLDELRATEYAHLDRSDQVYLDYTGAGVASSAQLRTHAERLLGACFGNPHSENPTSRLSTELIESARGAVLEYLRASPDEYTAIFTANATGACRLVGEAYPFDAGTRFVLTWDNHNSVNGIREFARGRGARTEYVPVCPPDLRVDEEALIAALRRGGAPRRARRGGRRRGLLAYPAQSNFTGVQHPREWVALAHDLGYDVLLDAAAYLPTNRLDLSVIKPDFVPVSWYKVFGYPTGLGCLVARRDALARLRRPWFSGGTIAAVSVQGDWHRLAGDESAFEDGTLNFLSIPDVEFGLSWISSIGIDTINCRVACLTGWMLEELRTLTHSNGAPMVLVYGPTGTSGRGGTISFNLLDPDGVLVDERLVARESAAHGFSVRTGCFCNPGAGEGALGIRRSTLRRRALAGTYTIDQYLNLLGLPTGGTVRVSFGVASNVSDVSRFVRFAEQAFRDRPADTAGLAPRLRC